MSPSYRCGNQGTEGLRDRLDYSGESGFEVGSVTTLLCSFPLSELKRRERVDVMSSPCSTLFRVIIRSSRGLTVPQSGIKCGRGELECRVLKVWVPTSDSSFTAVLISRVLVTNY